MNKKILVVAVAVLALAMLATPIVSAKPSAEKNNSKFLSFVWHSENGASTPVEVMTNPPWAEAGEVIVTHTQAVWNLNPEGNNYVQIGENTYPIDAVTGYEGILYVQSVAKSPTYSTLNYRVYEKIMWGESNYIEIMCLERASLELLAEPPYFSFYASGTFNGHGEIDGQKVQVMGIREGSMQAVGFVLECIGTIQFLGNA